jgi:hypothetical protein
MITHDDPMTQHFERQAVEEASVFKFVHGRALLRCVCAVNATEGKHENKPQQIAP